jgi:hypothetical protein
MARVTRLIDSTFGHDCHAGTLAENDDGTYSLEVGHMPAVAPDGATSLALPPGHVIVVDFTELGPVMRAVPKQGG